MMYLKFIRLLQNSCACCTVVRLTETSTTASSLSDNFVQILTTHCPFWSTFSILTVLFLEKLGVLLIVSSLKSIVRGGTAMSITATRWVSKGLSILRTRTYYASAGTLALSLRLWCLGLEPSLWKPIPTGY